MVEDKGPEMQLAVLPTPTVTVKQWAERRREFNEWVNTQLKAGVDYGVIPGCDKPSLWQPGAQKIGQFYGCAVRLIVTHRERDVATGYLYVEITCRLVTISGDQIIGEGVGACSTMESKYRYRREWWNADETPPASQGWEKTRGSRWFRRIENRDIADTWNTVVKMGGKRALVAASTNISAASERFTQDAEDLAEAGLLEEQSERPKRAAKPKATKGTGGNGETHAAKGGATTARPTPPRGWTGIAKERDAFKAFLGAHDLTEAEARAIAGEAMGQEQPIARFSEWPHTRERLQHVLLGWLLRNRPWADPATHWIESDTVKARFWATMGNHGYDEVKVHEIIPSLHKWPGNFEEAVDYILSAKPEDRGQLPLPETAEEASW